MIGKLKNLEELSVSEKDVLTASRNACFPDEGRRISFLWDVGFTTVENGYTGPEPNRQQIEHGLASVDEFDIPPKYVGRRIIVLA